MRPARFAAVLISGLVPIEAAVLLAGGAFLARLVVLGDDLFATTPNLAIMGRVGWGWWALLFGLLWCWLLAAIVRRADRARGRAALGWAGLWCWIGLLVHTAIPAAPADFVYGGLAVGCLCAYLRRRWGLYL